MPTKKKCFLHLKEVLLSRDSIHAKTGHRTVLTEPFLPVCYNFHSLLFHQRNCRRSLPALYSPLPPPQKFTVSLFSITAPSTTLLSCSIRGTAGEVYCVSLLHYRPLRSLLCLSPPLPLPPLHFSLVPSEELQKEFTRVLSSFTGPSTTPLLFHQDWEGLQEFTMILCTFFVLFVATTQFKWLSIEKNLIYGWVQARAGNQNLKLDRTCATCNNC